MATLLIFKLSVQSSYAQKLERGAEPGNFDTLQWWFSESETWRVRTFAIDADIHPHLMASPIEVAVARDNTMKHYGDVILEQHRIEVSGPFDRTEIDQKMGHLGGYAALEIAPSKRFAFWNPDRRRYSSKTTPET